MEVGDILREYSTAVVEFRAAVIVGAGSVSFEMVRYLTERLPIMITPKWLYTRTQPIAVDDVLAYLLHALNLPNADNQIVEIGGKDAMPYIDVLMRYAKAVNLKRYAIPVPLLAPRLSSYWVHLVTPISWDIAQPLILSLEHEVVVTNDKATQLFPEIEPIGYDESVRRALKDLDAKKWKPHGWIRPPIRGTRMNPIRSSKNVGCISSSARWRLMPSRKSFSTS